jgi:PAS domain S-box-containing protein
MKEPEMTKKTRSDLFDSEHTNKLAENKLVDSSAQFRSVFEQASVGIVFVDLDNKFFRCNAAFCNFVGYSEAELIGKTIAEITHPEDLRLGMKEMKWMVDGELASFSLQKRYVKKDGEVVWGELNISLVRDANNKPLYFLPLIKDISKRKRAEALLQNSEERYRRLVETTNTGYVILDANGTVVDANPEYVGLSGHTKLDEILGRCVVEWTADEEKETNAQAVATCLKNGFIRNFEITYVDKKGIRTPVEINATVMKTEGKQQILTLCRDITGRKRAENVLRESEEKYRVLFEGSAHGILAADAETGRFVFANPSICLMLGYSGPEMLRLGIADIHPKQALDFVKSEFDLMVRHEKMVSSALPCLRKDGHVFFADITAADTFFNGRRCLVGFFADVTERKQAEEAVEAEKERLAVTLHSIGDAVIATDVQGDIVLMNKVAEDLTGWPLSEATGKPLSDIFNVVNEITREHLENPVEKVLSSGNIVELANHTLLISRDGEERVIADSGAPIKGGNDKIIGVVLVFRDITEKQKFMNTIQRTAKLDSLGILAGGIAHDFNNLLTGIYGYMDLARSVCRDTQISEYLEAMLSTMKRTKALTLQLLTFAKGGSPVQKITPLVPFIQETAKFALSGSNIACRFSLAENLRPCNIDKDQIAQVIDNIVINAQQAMPDGGAIEITVINISFGENEHPPLVKGVYVKVSIKDTGIGIPKEIIPRIFDPFYTTKIKGHGLGLATCHSIINRHGGCIDVDSEPGKGSAFHVYLPASSETVIANAAIAGTHKGRGTIIVMDDEAVVRDTFRQMLELLGYSVICKNDGKEALEFYRGESKAGRGFTAMFFDLTVVGGMGGMEAVTEIRKLNKNIPVFVASGYADNSVMKAPIEYGFTASIAKPFTMSELSEMLNNYLKPNNSSGLR